MDIAFLSSWILYGEIWFWLYGWEPFFLRIAQRSKLCVLDLGIKDRN